MRIAIYDNTANNAYIQAKAFRRNGQPVDLVLDPRDRFVMSDPRWEDLDLELPTEHLTREYLPSVPYADWVRDRGRPRPAGRLGDYAAAAAGALTVPSATYSAWRRSGLRGATLAADRAWVIRTLRQYDCVIAYGLGPLFAALAGVPCLAQTWGSDIMYWPFLDSQPGASAARVAEAKMHRWGLGRAKRILLTDPRFKQWVERLGMTDKQAFVPFIVDTHKYCPGPEQEIREQLLDGRGSLLVFMPSRQDWTEKRSDLGIEGFAKVAQARDDVLLVCAGWGPDLARSKQLAEQLGVASRVRFLPYAASKARLVRYYRAADIVFDQFFFGSYGTSTLEALSCGRPVFIYLNREHFDPVFEELPPVVNVREPDEIAKRLEQMLDDPGAREQLGNRARDWVVAHHGDRLVAETMRYVDEAAAA